MNKISRIAAGFMALALLASYSVAAPKGATCPKCKMSLSKTKDKTHTVAVKIKGKTMYCCAGCGMMGHKK